MQKTNQNTVGKIIKDAINKKGIKNELICRKLGIRHEEFLHCLEGKKEFDAAQFLSVCIFLGLNIDDFKELYRN